MPRIWKIEARRYNSKILYWPVNKLRESSQSGIVRVKDGNGATSSDKEGVTERWAEHFENVLNQDRVAATCIGENKKVCDALDVKKKNLARKKQRQYKKE